MIISNTNNLHITIFIHFTHFLVRVTMLQFNGLKIVIMYVREFTLLITNVLE